MTGKIYCPVCGKEIIRTYYASEWGTEEEFYHCDNCGYGYEFAYGNYMEYINGKEFPYTYRTPEHDLIFVQIKEETNKLKMKIINQTDNHKEENI